MGGVERGVSFGNISDNTQRQTVILPRTSHADMLAGASSSRSTIVYSIIDC